MNSPCHITELYEGKRFKRCQKFCLAKYYLSVHRIKPFLMPMMVNVQPVVGRLNLIGYF